MAYKVDETCVAERCGDVCIPVCPVEAISLRNGEAWINPNLCISCGVCESVCPAWSISPDPYHW